jgi:hypothetical protein
MQAVKKLLLLEELHLRREAQWTEKELKMLLPPPACLQKLELASPSSSGDTSKACWQLIHKLQLYGIDVRMQKVTR